MKTAVVLEMASGGGYGNVGAVLLGEGGGRKALETFAKTKGVTADITNIIGDHWRLSIPYKAVDGNTYEQFYTAVIVEAEAN
jgi:hypothetical protein